MNRPPIRERPAGSAATGASPLDGPRPFGVLPVVRPVRGLRPWALGLVYLVALLPLTFVPRHSGNVLSRYMTIEAIVERGTLAVERTPMIALRIARPVDMVRFGDHYYSDKPPVLAALASPIYAGHGPARGRGSPGRQTQFVLDNLAITWLTVGPGLGDDPGLAPPALPVRADPAPRSPTC